MRGTLSSRDVTSFTATGATSAAEAALAAGGADSASERRQPPARAIDREIKASVTPCPEKDAKGAGAPGLMLKAHGPEYSRES